MIANRSGAQEARHAVQLQINDRHRGSLFGDRPCRGSGNVRRQHPARASSAWDIDRCRAGPAAPGRCTCCACSASFARWEHLVLGSHGAGQPDQFVQARQRAGAGRPRMRCQSRSRRPAPVRERSTCLRRCEDCVASPRRWRPTRRRLNSRRKSKLRLLPSGRRGEVDGEVGRNETGHPGRHRRLQQRRVSIHDHTAQAVQRRDDARAARAGTHERFAVIVGRLGELDAGGA